MEHAPDTPCSFPSGPVQTRDETVSALKSATCLRSTMHLRWNGAAAPLGLVESAMRRAGHPFFGGATQRRKHVALQGSETSGNTAVAGEDETAVEVAPALTMETVNFPGLKKEMERLTTRQMKRVSKVDQRSRIAEQEAAAGKVDFREDETPDVLRIALRLEVRPPRTRFCPARFPRPHTDWCALVCPCSW